MKEDFFDNHPLFNELGSIMSEVVSETLGERKGRLQYEQKRDFFPHESYCEIVLLSASEVRTALRQILQSSLLLSNYRSTSILEKNGFDRFDHVIYHLENFIFRVVTCFDRCLVLINFTLDLGNEPKECRYELIKKDAHVKKSKVSGPLAEIHSIIKPYKGTRDIVAHRKRYNPKEVHVVEMLYLVGKSGYVTPLQQQLTKRETDRFVTQNKEEMLDLSKKLQAAIKRLFDQLKIEFDRKYKLLKPTI
jgi:Cthe_2314-like HEPN